MRLSSMWITSKINHQDGDKCHIRQATQAQKDIDVFNLWYDILNQDRRQHSYDWKNNPTKCSS